MGWFRGESDKATVSENSDCKDTDCKEDPDGNELIIQDDEEITSLIGTPIDDKLLLQDTSSEIVPRSFWSSFLGRRPQEPVVEAEHELIVEVLSATDLSAPEYRFTDAIKSMFGKQETSSSIYVLLELPGRRCLATLPVVMETGNRVVNFSRTKLTFKYAGEHTLNVRVFSRRTDWGSSFEGDPLIGEGAVFLDGGIEDTLINALRPKEILNALRVGRHVHKVVLHRHGPATGEVMIRVTVAKPSKPITCGPAATDETVAKIAAMPLDALDKVLSTLGLEEGVPMYESVGERVDMLLKALENVERDQAETMEKTYEMEQKVSILEEPRSSFWTRFPRAWPWSADSMLLEMDHSPGPVRFEQSLVETWVSKRIEIKDTCLAMARDLDGFQSKCAGVGILASISGLSSSGLQLAAFASATVPAAAPLAAYQAALGIAATSTGLGEGVMNFAKKIVQQQLEANSEKTVFQLVAQENAIHRKVWRALQGYARTDEACGEIEDLLAKAKEGDKKVTNFLQDVFPEVKLIDLETLHGVDGTVAHVSAVTGFFSTAQAIVTDAEAGTTAAPTAIKSIGSAANMPCEIRHLYSAAKDLTSGKPSECGDRLRKVAERAGFDDLSVQDAVGRIMKSPVKSISPAPSGVVMFDATMTTRAVRMGLRRRCQEPIFFDQCTPVTLTAHQQYEVFFQVSTGVWVDVKEYSQSAKAWVQPSRVHSFKLDGSSAYRWFHIKGPWPLWVDSVENEEGPMW
uniref:Uncharacterized protein n=1 Tax=Noctiluca scintillans TaxID=2966 RepID=A0A7S1AUF3_NOCSC